MSFEQRRNQLFNHCIVILVEPLRDCGIAINKLRQILMVLEQNVFNIHFQFCAQLCGNKKL